MADVSLIGVNPHINHGQASVAGTRVMVTTILDFLAGGMSEAEILAAYPTLTRDGLRAAVAYGADTLQEHDMTTRDGDYAPSPFTWVRDQVETYERTGGREGNTLLNTGLPVIIVTTRGNKTGQVRKTPVMRVEHDGEYALVASMGGAPKHPVWYYNLRSDPAVTIQDGPEPFQAEVRELQGEERAVWWERAVAAYPPYAEYQQRTQRVIPVFLARRRPG